MEIFVILTPVDNSKQSLWGCRVRYAPSPTGYLHLGNARTALFNFLFARHFKGQFIIRNEDTDENRNIAGSFTSQMQALKWLGISPDESPDHPGPFGPYQQSKRIKIYHSYFKQFLAQGLIYRCFCTPEELTLARKQHYKTSKAPFHYSRQCAQLSNNQIKLLLQQKKIFTLRWKVPANREYKFNDLIRGPVKFKSSDIGDWIVMKANQTPTFNFAVAVDDALMKISHVIRGEEHISNTPLQLMVYEALNYRAPVFAHLNLISDRSGRKLSKRNCDQGFFISYYQERGYLPAAVFNFLTLLGWNPGTTQEIFTIPELIKNFNPDGWNKSKSKFEIKRLQYVSHIFFKNLKSNAYLKLVMPFLIQKYGPILAQYSPTQKAEICLLYQEQISYGSEIISLTNIFFAPQTTNIDSKTLATWSKFKPHLEQIDFFRQQILNQNSWSYNSIQKLIYGYQTQFELKGKKLYTPLRIIISHQLHGPPLAKLIYLLGQNRVLKNIEHWLAKTNFCEQ